MNLKLAAPGATYNRDNEAAARGAIERADNQNLKRGVALDYVLLKASDNGQVGKLTADSAGVLTWTAL